MYYDVIELLKKHNLSHLADTFESYIRESLVLKTTSISNDDVEIGLSKIGGLPDLSTSFEWPQWNNKHLSFVCQINLSDLPRMNFLNVLPQEGLLSFFYTFEQDAWGFSPEHKGGWRIIFSLSETLSRHGLPNDLAAKNGKYSSCRISFQHSITIPNAESIYMKDFELKNFDKNYINFCEEFDTMYSKENIIHRLLGHPDPVQGAMEVECQLASNGIYCGNPDGYKDPGAPALRSGARDWRLLLQIDSDEKASMMWGDVGRIYYWIRKDDLAARNFNNAWFDLQCC